MPEVILPTLPPLSEGAKKKLIMIADTYARGHKENVLHYLETGEIKIEELPLLDRVPEIKEWLVQEYNAWRYPVDPLEQSARAALEAQLPLSPDDLASLSLDKRNALEASLRSYVTRFGTMLPSGNIVSRAQSFLDEIGRIQNREKEKEEWTRVDILNYDALIDYLRRHPETPFFSELDNHLWDIVSGEPVDISLIRKFLKDMPRSSHFSAAAEIDKEYADWEEMKGRRNLEEVFNYMKSHPLGVFYDDAQRLLGELKKEFLETIRSQLGLYTIYHFKEWTRASGIFSVKDFFDSGIVTEESLKALELKESPTKPDLRHTKTDYNCPSGCTDVFFLGIPSTGKTCILMGLLNAVGHLDWDPNRFGGDYGCDLQTLCDAYITPPSTPGDFATLITGKIVDDKKDGVIHKINLIEMAGEAFAEKIARNPDATVTISDLGDGIPQMLTNSNDKVFFIVIDPTEDIAMYRKEKIIDGKTEMVEIPVPQRQTMNKFCHLLGAPENEAIMRKVKGLYIIATKADCLGPRDVREKKSTEIINDRYGDSVFTLKGLCHPNMYDLNAKTQHEIRVFPFSLGEFYLGNVFKYNRQDSDRILSLISMLDAGESVRKSPWDRIREWFNKR